ncbi:uncharacterized protein BO88DRAFT_344934, partial [Aspergillus vadensis CBS 113365]
SSLRWVDHFTRGWHVVSFYFELTRQPSNTLYYTESAPLNNSKPNLQAVSGKNILIYKNNISNRNIILEINSIIINGFPDYPNNMINIFIKALTVLICEYIPSYNILNPAAIYF